MVPPRDGSYPSFDWYGAFYFLILDKADYFILDYVC